MPLFEYVCDYCGHHTDSIVRADAHPCDNCDHPARRKFSFAYRPDIPEHLSPTTGQVVRNSRDFRDQLKAMSDVATERTGITHNFVPTDPTDMKANGVTEEGLKETYDAAPAHARKVLDKYI